MPEKFWTYAMEEMSYPDVQEILKRTDIVLIPIGSQEKHGPHIPLACDSIATIETTRRAAVKAEVPYTPLIPVGYSPHHMGRMNEGMGSLYEQSSGEELKIRGLTNWRLAGLQEAIRAKKVPSFEALTGTTDNEFYRQDRGTNYAQARYLCYYLQEKGLLEKFYHDFSANHEEDPTGYETQKRILGENDMQAFKTKWEKFVLGLRFP